VPATLSPTAIEQRTSERTFEKLQVTGLILEDDNDERQSGMHKCHYYYNYFKSILASQLPGGGLLVKFRSQQQIKAS